MQQLITNSYLHELACAYHLIDRRGILVDTGALLSLRKEVVDEILNILDNISIKWNIGVYAGPLHPATFTSYGRTVNINSTSGDNSLLNTLKELGYKIPKIRKKNTEGEFEAKESTNELALRLIFAETGDESIKNLMRIRELNKMLTTYIDCRLYERVFYSNYNPAGTVTGRRGSKEFIFGYGGNAQNFPKHSKLGKRFRECLIARSGCIFLSVDQMSAEDWPVSALANNTSALEELRKQIDRHTNLAAFIFNIAVNSRSEKEWKDSIERYLGKKTRHANNYGMQPSRMSEQLAQEGFGGAAFSKQACALMLERVNIYDPSIKTVFHKYIQDCLGQSRTLRNPFGRERQFFGLRPNSPNYEVYNEAYSWIPQSVVGDNTGLAILDLFRNNNEWAIQEAHDSIIQECPDNERCLLQAFRDVKRAFTRTITFHNSIEIEIPIECEIGYSFATLEKVKYFTEESLLEKWRDIRKTDASYSDRQLVG